MLRMLTLLAPSADVRDRFVTGQIGSADQMRDPLLSRWGRVRAYGLLPDHTDAAVVDDNQLSERRERLAHVLRGQPAMFEPLVRDMESRSVVAVVADPDGVVLHRHAGEITEQRPVLDQLCEGARWSEDVRGTNAVGTSLAERHPIGVLGGAHFDRASSGIFCYAAPVFDPQGELVCTLDVSGPMTQHDAAFGVAVCAASAALERVLRLQLLDSTVVGGLATLSRVIDHLREPAFVVDLRGQVLCCNAHAQSIFEDLGKLERHASAWFDAVRQHGHDGHAGKAVARGRKHVYPLTLEPLLGLDGRAIALLVIAKAVQVIPRVAGGLGGSAAASSAGTASPNPRAEFEHLAFADVLGNDSVLEREKARACVYARTEIPVLLLAETGTGKELFARAIHAASARRTGPFVPINCSAVPPTLLESELFGHAPHAFTGASPRGTEGRVGAANGGTLFLDEIGDMPAALQGLLLRFLDDGSYHRVGDSQLRKASVRIVCATCKDLPAKVKSGDFRQDLFYRIQGACVSPPPLRERSDRVWLAQQLLAAQGHGLQLAPDAQAYIERHVWPGNIRELKSALLQASAFADAGQIEHAHFSAPLLGDAAITQPPWNSTSEAREHSVRPRDLLLREAVDDALRLTNGNLSEAARRLQVARSTLYRILRRPTKAARSSLDSAE